MESRLLVYAAVLLTGIFVFSAQVLVYAFVGHLYPPEIRGTALGVAAGVGRVGAIVGPSLGGTLVTAGVAYPWGFYAFTLVAVLAVLHPGYSSGARERRRLTFGPQRGVPVSGRLPCMAGNSSHPGASGDQPGSRPLPDVFDEDHRRLALTELAARADLPLPTAHRLVGVAGWGALDRDTSGQYVIGRRLWDLGLLAPLQAGLAEIASPYLHDLYGATLATVHLAVRDGHEVLYLDRVRGHASVPIVSTVGSRLPMHATGVGKVLLAHAPVDVQHRVLAELSRITPYTITQPGQLKPPSGTGAA